MDRRADYKQKLIKRLRGHQEEVEEPNFDPTDDLTDIDLADEEQDADWGFLEPLPEESEEVDEVWVEPVSIVTEESLATFYEEGYTAFINGVPRADNPIVELEEGDADEKEVLTTVWEDGWNTARKDQLMADVILAAREVVESEDDEVVEAMFSFLTERVKDLAEVIDLETYEEFWWPE